MIKRIAHFDNMKFILIFLVVLGHIIEPMISANQHYKFKILYLFIYSFHMPLFIFISGYFTKIKENDNLFLKYLLPYAFFQLLYALFNSLLFEENIYNFSLTTPYFAQWYLLSMFFWNLLLPYINKLKHPILISALIAILIGYDKNISLYLSISRTLCFLPFFLLGYYANKRGISLEKLKFNRIVSISIICITAMIFIKYGKNIGVSWFQYSYSYYKYGFRWYYGFYRVFSYALGIILSLVFISIVPTKETIFTKFGSKTLNVYLLHIYFVRMLSKYNIYNYLDTTFKRVILILIAAFITLLLSSEIFSIILRPILNLKDNKIFSKC